MKKQWIILRTACAIFIIFALGVWVGKQLGPSEETLTQEDIEELSPTSEVALREIKKSFHRAMQKYNAVLKLTTEQQKELRPLFVSATKRMALLDKNSKARLAVVEDFHAEIAKYLTDEQKVAADQILKEARTNPRK
jgi:hypothetical protein